MVRATLIILLFPLFSFGTNYYVSNVGNNGAAGTTQGTAWQTLARVQTAGNNHTILAGDSILFRRGDTFTGVIMWATLYGATCVTGTVLAPITFAAYGSGAKPKFQQATANGIFWTIGTDYIKFYNLNITDLTFPTSDKINTAPCQAGIRIGEYNGTLSNHCTIKNCDFSNIGGGIVINGDFNFVDSCTITDLKNVVNNPAPDNDYGANSFTITGNDNTITHCYMSGAWAESQDYGWNGGAFEMFDNCNRNIIEYNTIVDCGGVSEYGAFALAATASDNLYAYNKIINCGNLSWVNTNGTFAIQASNIQYFNNVIVENSNSRFTGPNTGAGVVTPAVLALISPEPDMLAFSGTPTASVVYNLRNNIFNLKTGGKVVRSAGIAAKTTHLNNIYRFIAPSATNFTLSPSELNTLANIWTDTTNIDPSLWNFIPVAGSPAIAFGINVSITRDFNGAFVRTPPFAGIIETSGNRYVSNAGSDANDGLTPATAWLTIAKVNATTFGAGDSILFRRGDTFRGNLIASNSGSVGSPIVYGAYGAGAIPIISGAKNYSSPAQWQVYSGNIWKTVAPVGSVITSYVGHHDVGNLIFNNATSCGKKEILVSSCNVQGDWTILAGDTLYLFSLGNPGTFYSNIEVGGVYSENVIKISGKNYITVENLDVRYSGNNEIFIETCTNIKVDNCKFQWTGGWWFDAAGKRMGNGVQMWQTNSNIEVSNNYIYETYDAGISPQGNPVTYTQANISMHHNTIEKAYYSYEVFLRTPNTFSNLTFEYNTCINAGYQWSQHQRPDSLDAEHIRQALSTGTISGCTIRYNSFLGTYNRYAQMDVTSGMICNFNCFANIPIYGKFNGTTYTTLAQWRTGSSFDINSTLCTPVANAGADQAITLPTNSISLLGSGTAVTGNTITAYLWLKLASSPAGAYFITNTNPGLSLSNLIAGTYQFSLTVTDNAGSTNTDTMQLIVTANPNLPPVANAGIDQTITLPTSSVTLSGSGSTDPDGTITAYAWNYISGPAGSTITTPAAVGTTVTGLVQGVYVFSLTVTDNNGGVNSDGVQITVNAAAIPPPTTGTIMLRGWKIIN